MNAAIILNLSGHRVPENVFENLRGCDYDHFTIFSEVVHIDVARDIGVQVKEVLHLLLTKKNSVGMTAMDCEGSLFLLLPGHATAAVLIYTALEKMIGYAIPLIVTAKDNSTPKHRVEYKMVGEPFYVKGFAGAWRVAGRRQYVLGGGVREKSYVTPAPQVREGRTVRARQGKGEPRKVIAHV